MYYNNSQRKYKNAFDLAEDSGRAKALRVLKSIDLFDGDYNDYKIVPMQNNCHWDFEIRDSLTGELIAVVEAKDRKFPSDDYKITNDGGAQLELLKYEELKRVANEYDIMALLLCTFTDNRYIIWDINNTNVSEDVRFCNKTTAILTDKIEKHCYYFPLSEAIFFGHIPPDKLSEQ